MCRYTEYGPYKVHFACFRCRKGFKRHDESEWPKHLQPSKGRIVPAPCPECGEPMANMGLDFNHQGKRPKHIGKSLNSCFVMASDIIRAAAWGLVIVRPNGQRCELFSRHIVAGGGGLTGALWATQEAKAQSR